MRKRNLNMLAGIAVLLGVSLWTVDLCHATRITFNDNEGFHAKVYNGHRSYRGIAGEFQLTVNDGHGPFQTVGYCAELEQSVTRGRTYRYDLISMNDSRLSQNYLQAAWLVSRYAPGLGHTDWFSSDKIQAARAAVQMAVWEVLYEKSGKWDIQSGSFKATGLQCISGGSVISLANTLLSNLKGKGAINASELSNMRLAHSGCYQDIFVAVPLPGTFILLGSGLLCLLGLRRRIGGSTYQVPDRSDPHFSGETTL